MHLYQAAAISKGFKGKELTDMKQLKEMGVPCFTDDGLPLMNAGLVREAMVQAASLDCVLSFHEEDPAFVHGSGINEGAVSEAMGLMGAMRDAENVMEMCIRDRNQAVVRVSRLYASWICFLIMAELFPAVFH